MHLTTHSLSHNFLKFFSILFVSLLSINSLAYIVVLDAGHGGKDPGALGTYSKEKNINLNVVLRLGKMIQDNCQGVTVIYTRKTDKFVELDERANIANNAKADLFISVHTNSAPSGSREAVGVETYSLSLERAAQNLEIVKRENSVISYEENRQKYLTSVESTIMNEIIMGNNMRLGAMFAKTIQDEYVKIGRHNRGIGQAGFLVLRKTAMPSVLTELGFISTPSEEAYLNSEQGINELATSIYNAFRRHISPIMRGIDYAETQQKPQTEISEPKETEEPKIQQPDQPQQKPQPVQSQQKQPETPAQPKTQEKYEFRVQILTSDRQMFASNAQFKGTKDIDSYQTTDQNGRRKYCYTSGHSQSYREMKTLQTKLSQKFPGCFVVVLKNGQRIINEEAAAAIKKQP